MPRDYDRHRDDQARRSRERSEAGRDIGPLPPVADPARKAAGRLSLRAFCETYLAARFALGWSGDHLKVIAKLESAVLHGGLFALAMPRGSGKTTLCEAAALWAILYGHRRFVVLIGATDAAAVEMLSSVKLAVETNDELGADFPEACHPVRALDGIHHRANGQTLGGARTRIEWTDNEVTFPTVPGAAASGARIRVAGITGRVRGMKAATADGATIRPDFAIADDPQTEESAGSLVMIAKREKTLRGAVKGLAGPGQTISMVVPCTVISPGDLSDRILDRDRNPQFAGERMRMVYSFPARQDLWDEYAELRRASLRADGRGEEATAFYAANRAAMDAGAAVAWAERYDPANELSALQAAMNLRTDNPREFAAEYQNDPEPEGGAAAGKCLDADLVAGRLVGTARRQVPAEAVHLTAFIDVGGALHWYAVVAWDARFGGCVIDYGTWPRQARAVFARDDPRPGLADLYPGVAPTAAVFAGLRDLAADLLGRAYPRDGGAEERVEVCLVDSGWETPTVQQFVRQVNYPNVVVYPSKGFGRTTTGRGVGEWKPRPGEKAGHHWRLTRTETGRGKTVQFDPDTWKTFAFERLTTPPGARGFLGLWGKAAAAHELVGQHCAAEAAEPHMWPWWIIRWCGVIVAATRSVHASERTSSTEAAVVMCSTTTRRSR